MHLIVESSADTDRLKEFVAWCRQACMALQTVTKATPAPTTLYLNGEATEVLDVSH